MVRSEGNMSLKNPVTPTGIDPGTVRLVAQRLNPYASPGPAMYLTVVNRTNKAAVQAVTDGEYVYVMDCTVEAAEVLCLDKATYS